MSERLLGVLWQQALLLSVGVVLVGALRPLLLRRLGAGSVYAAWLLVPALLVPALLLTPLLPRPAQEPLLVVLQAAGTAKPAAMPSLPAPPPDHAAIWLALWLAGAALVSAAQAGRLQLKVERSQGGDKTTIEARVIGRDGERVMLRLNGIPGAEPGWTKEPLSITLWPKKAGDSALIKTQISHGEPGVELGHPSVMSAWGQKARIEIGRANSDEKFVLELTPTAMPNGFKPPKNTF